MHRSVRNVYRLIHGRSVLASKNSSSSRRSQLLNMLGSISTSDPCTTSSADIWTPLQLRRHKSTAASAAYDQSVNSFPSIVIGPNGSIVPQGSFAEAQAEVRQKYDAQKKDWIR